MTISELRSELAAIPGTSEDVKVLCGITTEPGKLLPPLDIMAVTRDGQGRPCLVLCMTNPRAT
jgi:hypothetical protein